MKIDTKTMKYSSMMVFLAAGFVATVILPAPYFYYTGSITTIVGLLFQRLEGKKPL